VPLSRQGGLVCPNRAGSHERARELSDDSVSCGLSSLKLPATRGRSPDLLKDALAVASEQRAGDKVANLKFVPHPRVAARLLKADADEADAPAEMCCLCASKRRSASQHRPSERFLVAVASQHYRGGGAFGTMRQLGIEGMLVLRKGELAVRRRRRSRRMLVGRGLLNQGSPSPKPRSTQVTSPVSSTTTGVRHNASLA
jgi:hypothetical protein